METTFTNKSLLFLVIVLQLFISVIFYKFDLLNEFTKEEKFVHRPPRIRNPSDQRRSTIFLRETDIQMITMKKVNNSETKPGISRRDLDITVSNTTLETNYQSRYDISPDYENVFLLMMVTTTPDSFKRRHEIRTTWGGTQKQIKMTKTTLFKGRNISTAIELVFVLGLSGDENTDNKVKHEAEKFGDILRVSISESYKNIVHKILAAFSWANTIKPRYILKADHDVYINVVKLRDWLLKASLPQYLYSGFIHTRARVVRFEGDPHYVSRNDLKRNTFPDYCAGPCYVMSQAFLSKMIAAIKVVKVFEVEDAFVGVVANHLRITPFRTNFFKWDRNLNRMYMIRQWDDEDLSKYICLGDNLDTNIINYLHFRYMQLLVKDVDDDFAS